jgi:hypothetical protein
MHAPLDPSAASRMAIRGAALTIAGVVLSGPIGFLLVSFVHPTGAWDGAAAFARDFRWIDSAPFVAGFGLILGWVMLVAGVASMASTATRPRATVAVIFTAVFAALITFNYICQTTFIPGLTGAYRPEYDGIVATFSMANPLSLSWAIEMWGYACLGVATWFLADVFERGRVERMVAALMRANGVVSIAAAILSAVRHDWPLEIAGFVAYCIWNVLIFVLAGLVVVELRTRRQPV